MCANVSEISTVGSSIVNVGFHLSQFFLSSEVRLSSLNDTVAATQEAFRDERLDPSPLVFIVSVQMVVGDEEGTWDFGYIPTGSSSERERRQRRMVFSNIHCLVGRAGCRPRIMACMYCVSGNVACVTALH